MPLSFYCKNYLDRLSYASDFNQRLNILFPLFLQRAFGLVV
ncbi:hypothetical protein LINPERHAP2_LOCUS35529 [Linum perenne]